MVAAVFRTMSGSLQLKTNYPRALERAFASTRPGYVEGQDHVDDVEERGLHGRLGAWTGERQMERDWNERSHVAETWNKTPTRSPQMSCLNGSYSKPAALSGPCSFSRATLALR